MSSTDLYTQILGLQSPWHIDRVELDEGSQQVLVFVRKSGSEQLACPQCGKHAPGYDSRQRRWRHLDTCQFQTVLVCDAPRVNCGECGIHAARLPWAAPNSGFTTMFENFVIAWLKEASTAAVARMLGLSWTAIDGIMARAVKRGRSRKCSSAPAHTCIDEVSSKRGHRYLSIVSDGERGTVEFIAEDRTTAALAPWFASLSAQQLAGIKTVSMDMWAPFINVVSSHLPDAQQKICFDKFHIAKHLGDAVNTVRRRENKALIEQGRDDLKGTRFDWLRNPQNFTRSQWREFKELTDSVLKTARAWALREAAMSLWHYASRTWAEKQWKRWLSWAMRSRLDPIKKVAKMIRRHLWGIVNAVVHAVDNAPAESINSRIKTVKVRARGFRNTRRMMDAIYFHLGGLDMALRPSEVHATHTI